jgi:glycine/D-amino acid oxidase-like deaminating enzyme
MARRRSGAGSGAEIVVVGAGVMGLFTALTLRLRGHDVLLVDAWGPGHPRATSSDESRVIRCGYGGSDFYSKWARRSIGIWREWQGRWKEKIFFDCGVLWFNVGEEAYARASVADLVRNDVAVEILEGPALGRRFPQIHPRGVRWSFLEPESGTILARRACQLIARSFESAGGRIRVARVVPGTAGQGRLRSVLSAAGEGALESFTAKKFVFACGPWLPAMFPDLLGKRIRVTRKEIFYFGTPAGDERFEAGRCPVWLELGTKCYGIPSIDGRGFKVGPDLPGRVVDPTTQDRRTSPRLLQVARACLRRRFPAMAGAPVVETRVCQYESTRDEQMIFDRHPAYDNAWIVGGGSGHCFKHGPVIGEMVADVVSSARTSAIEAVPSALRLAHLPSGSNF